jgi:hypothetical protein
MRTRLLVLVATAGLVVGLVGTASGSPTPALLARGGLYRRLYDLQFGPTA